MKIHFTAIAIALLGLLSCTNEIPLNVGDIKPKLIINSLLDCNQEYNTVILSFTGKTNTSPVTNAALKVYVNGELKEHIKTDNWEEGQINAQISLEDTRIYINTRFSPGDLVRIEASTNDNKYNAWAEVRVLQPIEIDKVDTIHYTVNDKNGGSIRKLKINTTFTDKPNERNYYRLVVGREDVVYGKSATTGQDTTTSMFFNESIEFKDDVVLNEGRPSTDGEFIFEKTDNRFCIFTDDFISGSYKMKVEMNDIYKLAPYYEYATKQSYPMGNTYNISDTYKISVYLKVRLLTITQSEYLYLKALTLFESQEGVEILTPPIKFPSNVNNGTGLVGVSSESSKNLFLFEFMPNYMDI